MANRHFLSDYFKNKTQSFKIKDSRTLKLIKKHRCKKITYIIKNINNTATACW